MASRKNGVYEDQIIPFLNLSCFYSSHIANLAV